MTLRLILNNLKLHNPHAFNASILAPQTLPLVSQTRGKSKGRKYVPLEYESPLLSPLFENNLTRESEEFSQRVALETSLLPNQSSPIIKEEFQPGEWKAGSIRVGTIGKKIGVYPMWTKNGVRVMSTLIQLIDNHVLYYIPPEKFHMPERYRDKWITRDPDPSRPYGKLVVGAGSLNPLNVTDQYLKLFEQAGVMPKERIISFIVTDNAKLPPGQALGVTHYRVGDYVDVTNRGIDYGFQGVMKRWGFKGGPKTHGCTKSHRRGGSLQSGNKHNIWRGKKMPGMMGNRWITARSLQILRINYEHNVLYVKGPAVPGDVNSWVMVKDTYCVPFTEEHPPPTFPCDLAYGLEPPALEEQYHDSIHNFSDPSLTPFVQLLDRKKKKKKK